MLPTISRSSSLPDLTAVKHPTLVRSHSAPSLGASVVSVAASSEQPGFDSVDGRIKFRKFNLEILTPGGKGKIDINKDGKEVTVAVGVEVLGFGATMEVGVKKEDDATSSDERPKLMRQDAKDKDHKHRLFIRT
ncbi:hypothetical protein G7083_07130 [Vibrio sp. HDW18]|uniref:hypothetical protein n=1 Tax=Vibrio TaxID=662 RepID=UPI00140E8A44|nr:MULTISPECIES: hypothetical protein [unclassified Vibrio]QIL85643.1 hypothetical protein G7083_07130 [Vibrio sp. HDW18]